MGNFYIGTQAVKGIYVGTQKVNGLYLGTQKSWSDTPAVQPDYLCFTANTAGSTVKCPKAFEYSSDKKNWSTASTSTKITLTNVGDKIYLRNGNVGTPTGKLGSFIMTGSIAASGNIMSLVDNTCESLTIPCANCYADMFMYCQSLTIAPTLPATTLAKNCYSNMFDGCTSLTTPPELPATTLAQGCYTSMFVNCPSLTIAPALPATTLADFCYQYMFVGCESLTTAPELPVTTLSNYCYDEMFENCTSLTTAPELPATTLSNYCYEYMFAGCTSLTTAPALPATTLANGCYDCMFIDCTSLYVSDTSISGTCDKAWTIPASDTFSNTYSQSSMFEGCLGTRSSNDMPGAQGQSYTYYTQNTPIAPITYLPVGGRIFYIHNDNGATYKFYDANKVELTTQTVEGLANAVYYSVDGTPSADKFYVYNNELATNKQWGKRGTAFNVRATAIGSGKTNSSTCLVATDWESNSIWAYINGINTANTGSCNDWYIGSSMENDKLMISRLVNWFSSSAPWSSSEEYNLYVNCAICWDDLLEQWCGKYKNNTSSCFAIRSF